jgi:hypothetical protein
MIERTLPEWELVGHVDPPPSDDKNPRGLFFYLGPNHYPAGLYMPKGYDLDTREGEDGWKLVRVRDTHTAQVMTQWAMEPVQRDEEGEVTVALPVKTEGE